jgi:hypothetical protein
MPPEAWRVAFNVANVVIVAAILWGVAVRARRVLHARIMGTCFAADVLLVLLIELERHAIEQAVRTTSGLLRFHIAVSVAVLVLWVLQIQTGRRMLKGAPRLPRHGIQAALFLLCRLTNVVTAFMVGD